MKRRAFLSTVVTIAVAGCSSDGGTTQTPTETPTSTPTASPTQEQTGEPEFEFISFDHPDTVEVNGSFQIEMDVKNRGGSEGDFTSRISLFWFGGWVEAGEAELNDVEPGETRTWVSNEVSLEESGEFQFRVDELDEYFRIEVLEPTIVLEYTITAGTAPDAIPEDIRKLRSEGGQLEEDYKWVVVEFTVIEGTLNMEDIWFDSRVETSQRYYDLDHATDELVDGVQSRGAIKQGSSGIALYQIPTDSDTYEWNIEQTDQNIESNKVE
jgi:hypothetical protein